MTVVNLLAMLCGVAFIAIAVKGRHLRYRAIHRHRDQDGPGNLLVRVLFGVLGALMIVVSIVVFVADVAGS